MHAPRVSEPTPAALLRAELPRLRDAARHGPLLDLACGSGRNALALARAGLPVVGLDRDAVRLAALRDAARVEALRVRLLRADLESGTGIPLADASCGAVLVFRYLHRALAPEIVRVLRRGGLLLYETFTQKHTEIAQHPSNPAFLLTPGELPRLFGALQTLRAEEAVLTLPAAAAVARLVAVKPG
jgi:SAM-dependent methyltransferase